MELVSESETNNLGGSVEVGAGFILEPSKGRYRLPRSLRIKGAIGSPRKRSKEWIRDVHLGGLAGANHELVLKHLNILGLISKRVFRFHFIAGICSGREPLQ